MVIAYARREQWVKAAVEVRAAEKEVILTGRVELVTRQAEEEEITPHQRSKPDNIGVEPKEIRLNLMKSKWASYSNNGRLTFNSKILRQPDAVPSEAIVHKLLHLKVPNHGKLFKNLMRAYLSKE